MKPYNAKRRAIVVALLFALPCQLALAVDDALRAALQNTLQQPEQFGDRYDAEVWLLPRSQSLARFGFAAEERVALLTKIHHHAMQAELDADLLLALIEVESGFDQYAVSSAGAQGLMQVMSFWKAELGRETDNLTDVDTNLRYGTTILAYYLDMEDGNLAPALARYNGSYGQTWYSERVFKALENWR